MAGKGELHMDEIKKLRLEEKIALCSGADAWHTKAFPEAGLTYQIQQYQQ